MARGSIIVVASTAALDAELLSRLVTPFADDPGIGAVCDPSTATIAIRRTALDSVGGARALRRGEYDRGPIAGAAAAGLVRAGWRLLDLVATPSDTSAPLLHDLRWEKDPAAPADPSGTLPWTPPRVDQTTTAGINLIGLLDAACGVGDAARRYAAAVAHANLPLATFNFAHHSSPQHEFLRHGEGVLAYDTNLLALNADLLPQFAVRAGRELWGASRYSIGLWFWELEELSPAIERGFNLVHEVWASSPFLQRAFASGTDKPVTMIPMPIERREGRPGRSRTSLGLPEGFLFATTFDFGSLAERKNAAGAVRAFCEAFAPGSGPVLVLKTLNAGTDRAGWRALRAAAGDRRDVVVVDGYLDESSLSEFIGHADCYISLHRAEGFGLTPAEAMAWGRPVIATGYSGNLAFMTAENSYLVGYSLVPVPRAFRSVYRTGSQWAEPRHDDAVAAMRAVVARPLDAAERGARGQRDIRRTNSLDATAAAIAERMAQIRQLRPSSRSAGRQHHATAPVRQGQ
jgi:glycosyltransferase involved in cell wall biosynthesis